MENVCVDAIIIVKLLKIVLLNDYYSFDQSNFIYFTLVYLHKNRRNLWQII